MLVRCRSCQSDMSDRLSSCTNCGSPLRRRDRSLTAVWMVIAAVVAVVGLVCGLIALKKSGINPDRTDLSHPTIKTVGVPAELMVSDYADNQVAAARMYEREKPIHVWGYVKRVSGGEDGSIVHLEGDDTFAEAGIRVVQCHFGKKHTDTVAKLVPGKVVSIRGKITGYEFGDVHMADCEFSIKPTFGK